MKSFFVLMLVLLTGAAQPDKCTPQTCALFAADNRTQYAVRATYVNGFRISGTLGLEEKGYFLVPRAALREGGKCAVVSVTLENDESWTSRSECAEVNEYFWLVIAQPISASSLAPMRGGPVQPGTSVQ